VQISICDSVCISDIVFPTCHCSGNDDPQWMMLISALCVLAGLSTALTQRRRAKLTQTLIHTIHKNRTQATTPFQQCTLKDT